MSVMYNGLRGKPNHDFLVPGNDIMNFQKDTNEDTNCVTITEYD